VLSGEAFVLRFFMDDGKDRLLLFNLACNLRLSAAPEPLLAPPAGREWELVWSSESPEYGGEERHRWNRRAAGSFPASAIRLVNSASEIVSVLVSSGAAVSI
jgi:hypothetical protein